MSQHRTPRVFSARKDARIVGHLGVTEDIGPLAEAEVRGDDDAGTLVELAAVWSGSQAGLE